MLNTSIFKFILIFIRKIHNNMNKKIIRLTERKLRRLISESISKIMEDTYSNPQGRPESRTNPYPEYASDFDDEDPMFPIPNKTRLHTLDRTTDSFSDWQRGDHAYYDDGEVYPSAEWSDTDMYGRPNHHSQWAIDADKDLEKMQKQRFKDNLDKQWQDTKDKEKYSKMADSRPLHRKGSLNRAMEEAIRKTVNKILKEESFNKNVPNDSLFSLNGDYDVYVDGQILNATIDVENEFLEIGDWSLDGKEAIDAITQIYEFYKYSNNTIESAIEQYAYDALR